MEKFSNECCDTLEKCWLHANQVIFLRINYLCELVVRSSVTFLTPLQAAFHWKLFLQRPAGFLGEGNGNPLQYSCLENPMDRGAW